MKMFVSWSGGKDAVFACYKVMQNTNRKPAVFLNMITKSGKHSRTHGIGIELLKAQSKAIGVPIMQRKTTWNSYEEEYKKALSELKSQGVTTGVFGDIDLQEHRDWIERVCKEMGIKAILPLWKKEREEIMAEFKKKGFKAIVVAVNGNFLGKEWLGRIIDNQFIKEIKKTNIDLCGEKGEYHSFVYDGPIFKHPVELIGKGSVFKDNHWFLRLKLKNKAIG